jgi:hypothetical protein
MAFSVKGQDDIWLKLTLRIIGMKKEITGMKIREVVDNAINDPAYADMLREQVQRAIDGGPGSQGQRDFASLFFDAGDEEGLNALMASPSFSAGPDLASVPSCWKTAIMSTALCATTTTTTTTTTLE